jgi:cyclophilin family peptidyl-prolyl cis-trans isomerase
MRIISVCVSQVPAYCVRLSIYFLLVLALALLLEWPPGLAQARYPQAVIVTESGTITVELDVERAPVTAANFLRYAEAGHYEGGSFFRTVTLDNQPGSEFKIEVIQAGTHPWYGNFEFDPIPLETTRKTGLRHGRGTISMARGTPNSATSSFFVCVQDEPELDFGGRRNPDGQGFAAFGRVVDGMDVVDKIHRASAKGQALLPVVGIERVLVFDGAEDPAGSDSLRHLVPPDTAALFLPGIVSTELGERDASFSPDGKAVYFTLWTGRFGTIMVSLQTRSGWTEPETATFSGHFNDLEPFVAPDGQRLYFASNRPLIAGEAPADYNLWYVDRDVSGSGWSEPRPVPHVNTGQNEFYPSVDNEGVLYWTAAYENSFGGEDIYFAVPTDSGFSDPVNAGRGVNTEHDEFNALIAPDGSWLAFGSFGRQDGSGGGDLYISFRSESDSLGTAMNMGTRVNSAALDFCPAITPDGGAFLFSSRRSGLAAETEDQRSYRSLSDALRSPGNGRSDLYWIDAAFIDELRTKASP